MPQLSAERRDTSRAAVRAIRASRKIPAVLYGPQITPASIAVSGLDFERLYTEAGESTIIDLVLPEAQPVKVLIQDIDRDPITNRIRHADFRQINMNKQMTANVVIHFVNDAPAVKELGAILVKAMDAVEVRCLPKDLVSSLSVDLVVLKAFHDKIHVRDLVLPPGIEVLNEANSVVVMVEPPLTEEQLKAMEAVGPADVSQVEVAGKKKEEEAAEGEGETEAGEAGEKGEKGEKKAEKK